MDVRSALLRSVDAAFAITGSGLAPWPDPHHDRAPPDEEYSRLIDPAKWRIIGARADAWSVALARAGAATVEQDAAVDWVAEPATMISRADRVVPLARGAIPLVVARSRIGGVADAGVTIGVGDPAVCVDRFPDCGCDACDSGSQDELDRLDARVIGVVAGSFRRLSGGRRTITVDGEDGWSASGRFDRGEVAAIIADPTGWEERSGASWLDPA